QQMLIKDYKKRMQSLKDFAEGITQYLKAQEQTIWEFGTFTRVPHNPWQNEVIEKELEIKALQEKMTILQSENSSLKSENDRHKRKVEILTIISQLGLLEGKRKRELWGEIARI